MEDTGMIEFEKYPSHSELPGFTSEKNGAGA
jgi:hypothetical protein